MSRFDKLTDRSNTNSIKWMDGSDVIPMWVADMDFETVPEVIESLKECASHGIFGYTALPKEWNHCISSWWKRRHNFIMEEENLMFCTGVVSAISSIIRSVTNIGDNIVVLTPVYNMFYKTILSNDRTILESKLVFDGEKYEIDFLDLEAKLANRKTSLFIFCNPHNPIGKIWDRDSIVKIGALCEKHNVVVLSDEIHCDLTDPGKNYIPFASVNDVCKNNSITCGAPTKTFNLAGLHSSFIYCSNQELKQTISNGITTEHVCSANAFAVTGTINAYKYGDMWLDELRAYLYKNKLDVINRIENETGVKVIRSEATYLLWLDCSNVSLDAGKLVDYLFENYGLKLSKGEAYSETLGKQFIRMNIACPNERLHEGLNRFITGVNNFK